VRNPSTDQIQSFDNTLANFDVIETDGWDSTSFGRCRNTRSARFRVEWQNSWVGRYESFSGDGSRQPLEAGVLVSDPVTRSISEWTSNARLAVEPLQRLVDRAPHQRPDRVLRRRRRLRGLPRRSGAGLQSPGQHHVPRSAAGLTGSTGEGTAAAGRREQRVRQEPRRVACRATSTASMVSTYDIPAGGFWYCART
jgi:hypothetical protein